MYKLTITNEENGYSLDFNNPSSPFIITEILGLDPPDATINIDEYAVLDGGVFNSAKANMRTMQIAFAIDYDAAASRQIVYRVLQPGRKVRIDYSDQMGLKVYTEGYVGKPEITHFAMKQTCTVTIICPEAYWQSAQEIVTNFVEIEGMFHFEFSSTSAGQVIFGEKIINDEFTINNYGNLPVGFVVEILLKGTATQIFVENLDTGKQLYLDYQTATTPPGEGDVVRIDTRENRKDITVNGVSTFWAVDYNQTEWPVLEPGENTIKVTTNASGEGPEISLTHGMLYEGV